MTNSLSREIAITSNIKTKEKEYWLEKLSGDYLTSIFPHDYEKPGFNEKSLERKSFQLNGSLFTRLLGLSKESDYKLYMVLTAGLFLMLRKYANCENIIIGTPIYKQDIEGDFVNTVLPLKCKVESTMTFKELLLQVRQTIVEATENQNYPVESLSYLTNRPGPGNASQLFDIAILLENVHDKKYLNHIHHNITFSFLKTVRNIEGVIEYNPALYKKSTIISISNHFTHLLHNACFNIDTRITYLEISPLEEKNRILKEFNNTRAHYPEDKMVHQVFAQQVEKTRDHIALAFGNEFLTYQELERKSHRLSQYLHDEKNICADCRVGIFMERSVFKIHHLRYSLYV